MAKPKKKISRRDFITASATMLAAGFVAGCTSLNGIRKIASTDDPDVFDYIVIGSGPGGGPVAVNLAMANYRVLLIEAGSNYTDRNYEVPAFQGLSTEDPNFSWNFFVNHYRDPKRQARDPKYVNGKGILYPRAGTLGGCSAHNALITLYPDSEDWNYIASITGDHSWNAESMRQYYQRVENVGYNRPWAFNTERRGLNGWLNVEQNSIKFLEDGTFRNIAAAAAETVWPGVIREFADKNIGLDPNNLSYDIAKYNGIFNIPKATVGGRRNGTREHILKAMKEKPEGLILQTNSFATKLLFDETNEKRIKGVEYVEGAHLYQAAVNANPQAASAPRLVFARREVILAGGAFNSPQLLMLSGIGAPSELNRHGIQVRHELPGVGRNLQDRYEVGVVTKLKSDIGLLQDCTFGKTVGGRPDPCLVQYDANHLSSLYSSNGVIVAVIKRSSPEKVSPDLVIFATPGKFTGYFPGWSADALKKDCFTWAVLKGHTKNTAGTVTLKSGNPLETPEINFNYFDEGNDASGEDLRGIMEGVRTVRQINSNGLIQSMSVSEFKPTDDDSKLGEFIMDNSWGHHASCTNKMGPRNDPMAVVDSQFKVHGLKGLRIVDASVFPKIPGLYIVAPVYMISEKASEVIIADAKKSDS